MSKILVIDDETKFQELIKIRLEANGYEVVSANDGQEGLEKVRLNRPDLIVLDALMPVMDGYTFYKELKKNRATLAIPVIVLTARGNMEDTFRIIGVDEFLTKPAKDEELLEKIDKLLSLSKPSSRFANKVLIAGPVKDVIEDLDLQLKKEKCETDLVTMGDQVVPKAISFLPQALLLDVLMWDMESSDIVAVIRKMPQTNKIPIILYSYDCLSELSVSNRIRKTDAIKAAAKKCLGSGATTYLGVYRKEDFYYTKKSFVEDILMYLTK